MSGQLTAGYPAETVYRVGRRPDPWAWPDWSQASRTARSGTAGTIRSGVTECSMPPRRNSALVETLARFRPNLEVVAGLEEIEGDEDARSSRTKAIDRASPISASTRWRRATGSS